MPNPSATRCRVSHFPIGPLVPPWKSVTVYYARVGRPGAAMEVIDRVRGVRSAALPSTAAAPWRSPSRAIELVSPGVYHVRSASHPASFHVVTLYTRTVWTCTCPWGNSLRRWTKCRHVRLAYAAAHRIARLQARRNVRILGQKGA